MGIEVVEILCEFDGTWHKAAEIRLDHVLTDPEVFEGLVREYWWDSQEGTSLDLLHAVEWALEFWVNRLGIISYSEELGYNEILRVESFLSSSEEWELIQVARGWWVDPTDQTEGWEVILSPEERAKYEEKARLLLQEIWRGKFDCPASYLK